MAKDLRSFLNDIPTFDPKQLTLLIPYEIIPQAQAGKLKALAISDEKRNPLPPDAPTFKELGCDITITTYTPLIGPKVFLRRFSQGSRRLTKKSPRIQTS
jgi:hypothetical protein